jgi:Protein of unknown function (DUF998)
MPLLFAAILSSLVLALGVARFASRTPGYRHARHTISELGQIGAPHSIPVSYGLFVPVGLCCLIIGALLRTGVAHRGLSDASSALALSIGAGYVGGGLFRCDPGCPLEGSWRQGVHNLAGGIEYIGGAASLWLMGSSLGKLAGGGTPGVVFTTGACVVVAAAIAMSTPSLFAWRGAVQRVAEVVLFGGLIGSLYLSLIF